MGAGDAALLAHAARRGVAPVAAAGAIRAAERPAAPAAPTIAPTAHAALAVSHGSLEAGVRKSPERVPQPRSGGLASALSAAHLALTWKVIASPPGDIALPAPDAPRHARPD